MPTVKDFKKWLRGQKKTVIAELTTDTIFQMFIKDFISEGKNYSAIAIFIHEVEKEK